MLPFTLKTATNQTCRFGARNVSVMSALHPPKDSKLNTKRVGRGPGSGYGKTSGRGQKGQKARGTVKNWFEGGQTPIYRIYPKRGFYRHQQLDLVEIPLVRIQRFYDQGKIDLKPGETLTMKKMKDCGLITGDIKQGVSIVGTGAGEYSLDIPIEATKASKSVVKVIESRGGKFTSVFFSRYLGYKAHQSPEWFIRKKGYLPMQAKPISRKDIKFYSDKARNGCLVDSEYVKQIRLGRSGKQSGSYATKTELDKELDQLAARDDGLKNCGAAGFPANRIVSFKDLKI